MPCRAEWVLVIPQSVLRELLVSACCHTGFIPCWGSGSRHRMSFQGRWSGEWAQTWATRHDVSQLTANGYLVGGQLPQHDSVAEDVHLHDTQGFTCR